MTDKPNYFCVLPWIHLATHPDGQVSPCCQVPMDKSQGAARHPDGSLMKMGMDNLDEIRNSKIFKNLRSDMLNDKIPELCQSCHKLENVNIQSRRMYENKMYPKVTPENVKTHTGKNGEIHNCSLNNLEIRLGNKCNLKCISCNPHSSSLLVDDFNKLAMNLKTNFIPSYSGYKFSGFDWFSDKRTRSEILKNVKEPLYINFNGGEPFLYQEHIDFLNEIRNNKALKNTEISYFTNLSILPKELIAIWGNFKSVYIYASIDDIGERNDYIRFPSKWDAILENLKKLQLLNVEIEIYPTLSILNIFNLENIILWFRDNFPKFNVKTNFLDYPEYLSMECLPEEIRRNLINAFSKSLNLNQIREIHSAFRRQPFKKDSLIKFLAYSEGLDLIRNTNINSVIPEIKMLKEYI